jgi:XapX domain-containing protein
VKIYIVSLATGLLVGVIYALLNVRSPAPPLVALIGLLGILIGEQVPPLIKTAWQQHSAGHLWLDKVKPPTLGDLPQGKSSSEFPASPPPPDSLKAG